MTGFWEGVATRASVDWCEPNYVYSAWVAEWWNTLSSVPIAGLGLVGLLLCRRLGRSIEPRFYWGFAALMIIGLGSMGFHGTMLKAAQASDELPMIYGSLVYTYILRWRGVPELSPSPAVRRSQGRWVLGLFAYGVAFTSAYFTLKDYFVFFIFTYALLVAWICIRSWQIAYRGERSAELQRLFLLSAGVYVGGFALLWVPEHLLLACSHPLQALNLHAFFHLTSAVGTFVWLLFAIYDRQRVLENRPQLRRWLPFLRILGPMGV